MRRHAVGMCLVVMVGIWAMPGMAQGPDADRLESVEAMLRALQEHVAQQDAVIAEQAETIHTLRSTMEAQELRLHDVVSDDEWDAYREDIDARLRARESAFGTNLLEFDNRMQRIHVGAGLTTVVQSVSNNTSALRDPLTGQRLNDDALDGTYSFDLTLSSPVGEKALVLVALEAGQGMGIDDEVMTFHGFNDDALADNGAVRVSEAYTEFLAFNDRLHAVFGKIDSSNYTDESWIANDETTQFLSPGFVNSIALAYPNDNSLGFHTFWIVNDQVEVHAGIQEADANYEDIFRDLFVIGEVHLRPELLGRPGEYEFYVWHNNMDLPEWDGTGLDDNWGAGISASQEITDRVSVFGRIGFQNEEIAPVHWAWSTGFQVADPLYRWTENRPADIWAVAVGQAILSSDYKKTTIDDENEWMIETYYSLPLTDRWVVSPHVQVAIHPGGESQSPVVTTGVRSQVDF